MQNNLLFVALANLDPPTYQITYQVGTRLRLGLGLGLGLGLALALSRTLTLTVPNEDPNPNPSPNPSPSPNPNPHPSPHPHPHPHPGRPNSGGSQFFLNVANNANLDWFSGGQSKHPVFGKVIEGI